MAKGSEMIKNNDGIWGGGGRMKKRRGEKGGERVAGMVLKRNFCLTISVAIRGEEEIGSENVDFLLHGGPGK